MGWKINVQGTPQTVIAYCNGVAGLNGAVLTLITNFCNAATGNVSVDTAGNYNSGFTLNLAQTAPTAGIPAGI